jgi:hypothetical protein
VSLAADHIMTMILQEIESVEYAILNGSCADYTMYREHIGMLAAFKIALDIARKAGVAVDEDVD